MKVKKPFIGIIAFLVVLITMPLGHALMIIMDKTLGHKYLFQSAFALGFIGLVILIFGIISKKESTATLSGLFSGLLIWTGWIEFAFVFFARHLEISPLIENGKIVTKPEYLLMPSSIGFWIIIMIYYFFGTKTGCSFFTWFQNKLKIINPKELKPTTSNVAIITFMELNIILWTFYLLLLFVYDKSFIGDDSIITHFVAYGSLLWSLYLFRKLIKISNISYAIRYAIPTVIIFWNFVEILGRWNILKEIWISPFEYAKEMIFFVIVIIVLILIIFFEKKKNN